MPNNSSPICSGDVFALDIALYRTRPTLRRDRGLISLRDTNAGYRAYGKFMRLSRS